MWSDPILNMVHQAQRQLNLQSNPKGVRDGEAYIALHFRRGEMRKRNSEKRCSSLNIFLLGDGATTAGDFEEHCGSLAHDQKGFTTWATLPALTSFTPPLDRTNTSSVIEHCYPDLARLVSMLEEHVLTRPHLRTLHILHDGSWLQHPRVNLQLHQITLLLRHQSRHWPGGPIRRITHSGNLVMPWRAIGGQSQQNPVWQGMVDLELARRAELFFGNGYSSLSSQVVALRLGADNGEAGDAVLL